MLDWTQIQSNPTRSDLCWTVPYSIQYNTLRSLLDYPLFNSIQHAQSLLDCPLFIQIQHAQIFVGLSPIQSNPTRSDLCWTVPYLFQSNTLSLCCWTVPIFNPIQYAQILLDLTQVNPIQHAQILLDWPNLIQHALSLLDYKLSNPVHQG